MANQNFPGGEIKPKTPDIREPFGKKEESFGDKAKEFGEKAKDTAKEFGEKAKDAASNVGEKAKDTASHLATQASGMATTVAHKAEDATSGLGCGMRSLADTVREKAPHSGVMGKASAAVADTLDTSGQYLQQQGLEGMAEDVTELIRKNPIPAVLIGIGLGFLLARVTVRS